MINVKEATDRLNMASAAVTDAKHCLDLALEEYAQKRVLARMAEQQLAASLLAEQDAETQNLFVIVNNEPFPIDTEMQRAAACREMPVGRTRSPIFVGDPECPDSYLNGKVLNSDGTITF